MTEAHASILKKIQALLNKTEDRGATREEAESAAVKVQDLLTKHNLSMSEAILSGEQNENTTIIEEMFKVKPKRSEGKWRASLAFVVARNCFCSAVIYGGRGKSAEILGFGVKFIGRPTDIAVAKELYEFLLWQIERVCREEWRVYTGWEKQKAFARGFYLGVVEGLEIRFIRERREAEARNNTVTALVVVTGKEVQKYMDQKYSNLKQFREPRSSSYDGRSLGYSRAQTMDVSPKRKITNG